MTSGTVIRNLVFFDGVCVLCDGTMRFLYQQDHAKCLWYASLQGETAEELNRRSGFLKEGLKSVVFVERYGGTDEQIFYRSDAILQILGRLSGVWRVLFCLRFIPRPIRDTVYDWIARNRYRWFGQKESCSIPDPAMRERYLQ